jgi:hypothetical protein
MQGKLRKSLIKQESSVASLAPKILTKREDLNIIHPYLDELKRALIEKGVTNIAVAGAYGSGKSTIIRTFQSLHRKYKYLNISLASFKDNEHNNNEENNKNEKNNNLERRLEVSILQQIFYHVKPSEIPDSRFKRINNTKWWKLLLFSLSLIVWLISVFILFKFDYISTINPSTWNLSLKFDWIAMIVSCAFFTGIGFLAKCIFRLFSNSKISKFNLKGELELGNNIDKSVFNEYLEEIIYFFERTLCDVVIIEDLDRFETTDIFANLRELNILLNTSNLIKQKVNFVYAVKDELFKNKHERVKFFDYIIPIIPFINASNASIKLNELIKAQELGDILTKDFIQDIVSFIDDIDMRLLINIVHEFCVYKIVYESCVDKKNTAAETPVETQDKLFAIIVYKNMYPDDFGKLPKRKGNLYDFISKKKDYVNDMITEIDNSIKENEEQIENLNGEKITSEKELKAIYINAIHEKIPNAIYLLPDKLSFANLSEDKNFDKLKKETNILYYYYNNYYNLTTANSNVSFLDIENHVNSNFSYDKRKQFVQEKLDNKVKKIKKEIESLINQRKDIEQLSLQEIFQKIDIEKYLGIFSKDQLMRMLLINGYINEDYEDYISLFHEGNITRTDEIFKRRVKSGISSPFDYPLSNEIRNLIKEIPDKYFKREVILNFDLLNFLSKNYKQYKSKYENVLFLLSNERKASISFFGEYIQRGDNLPLFVKSICHSWNNLWNFMYRNGDFPHDFRNKLEKYLKLIVEHAKTDDILLMNTNNNLSKFINTLSNFISLMDKSYYENIKNVIMALKIKFEHLEKPDEETKSLFDYIYENNLYEINNSNIRLILAVYAETAKEQQLEESNYSTILNSNCKHLIDYIEENISVYINETFLKLEENTKETEETVIDLLNNNVLDNAAKTDIAIKQESLITKISDIQDSEMQQMLIKNNKIAATWNNIYAYYKIIEEESDLDDILIDFLNKEENYMQLSKQAIENELNEQTEEIVEKFSLKIIYCNKLNYESYINLLKSTSYKWDSLIFEHLDKDKVKEMVNSGFLALTVSNFDKLKKNFSGEHIRIIERQQNNFFSIFNELTLAEDDILNLLKSKEITNENKVKLIEIIDSDLIIKNKDIAKIICDILSNLDYIPLNIDIIESLINSSSLRENKIKMLNKQAEELNNSQMQKLIETFGGDYEKLFIRQSKPKFSDTNYHRKLFYNLRKRKLIKKYEPCEDNQLRVYANY